MLVKFPALFDTYGLTRWIVRAVPTFRIHCKIQKIFPAADGAGANKQFEKKKFDSTSKRTLGETRTLEITRENRSSVNNDFNNNIQTVSPATRSCYTNPTHRKSEVAGKVYSRKSTARKTLSRAHNTFTSLSVFVFEFKSVFRTFIRVL